jgi:orotate phosphoribosyltransferase
MSAHNDLLELLARHAYTYREPPFILASGQESNHYIDCRPVLLDPDARHQAARLMSAVIDLYYPHVEGVAGAVLGAVPLVDAVGTRLKLPAVYVRPAAKGHGTKQSVEVAFSLRSGKAVPRRLIILEDVLTTGGTVRKTAELLREKGFAVGGGVCLVDRSEGNKAVLDTGMLSVFTLKDVLGAVAAIGMAGGGRIE